MSDEEAREALEEVLADGLWRLYQDPNGNPGVLIHEDPRTTAHAVLSIILASGLVVTAAEHDRQVAEKAWRKGHLTNWRRGPDNCHCAAYSAGECACGEYGTGKILSLDDNPYALSTALEGVQEESKA